MEEYGEVPVTSAIVATSSVSILGALLLLGLSVVAKPAHPATRGTRIAWYLTGFAALVLLSSHIPPLVAAIRAFVDRDALRIANHRGIDLGTVTFALQGLTLIFEIVACRSIFYATLPMSVTRRKKRTFIILDMFSFGALVGTFIGALAGTVDNEDRGIGLCGYRCQFAVDIAAVFLENTITSGGILFASLCSLVIVLAGAICGSLWSPHDRLARSLRIALPCLAIIQLGITLACIFIRHQLNESDLVLRRDYDPMYYVTIPFWLFEVVVLWFLQLALKKNPSSFLPAEGTDLDLPLKEQPMERPETTATA